MKKQDISLKINSIIEAAIAHERNFLFYLHFPLMWIWYRFWPAQKINLIQDHVRTMLTLMQEFASLAKEKHFNIQHARKLHEFLQGCINDQHLLMIAQVISKETDSGSLLRIITIRFFEETIRELSKLKFIFKHAPLDAASKNQLIRDIKQIQAYFYEKLVVQYLYTNQTDLMVNAAQKTLEGFEGMPDDVRATAYSVLHPDQIFYEGNKQDIITNQQLNINTAFFAHSIRKVDYEGIIHYFGNIVESKKRTNPKYDVCLAKVLLDLTMAQKHKEIICLSQLLVRYYSISDEIISESDHDIILKKRSFYASLAVTHKKLLFAAFHETYPNEKKIRDAFILDPEGQFSFQIKGAYQETLKKIKSLPISFRVTSDNQCVISEWHLLSMEALKALLIDLQCAVELQQSDPIQNVSDTSDATANIEQNITFDMKEMQAALPDVSNHVTPKNTRTSKRKKDSKSPDQLLPLAGLIDKLNEKLTAGQLGFTKVPPGTPVYPVSGKFTPIGKYYACGIDPSLKIDSQRAQNQEVLEAGQVVSKGKPGLRFLSSNEKLKHGKDTIMKIAIPHQNLRIGLVEEETRVKGDGQTITLCNAKITWRH